MKDWILKSEPKFRYQLLDRMRQDCEYYLRLKREFGNDMTASCLWADSEEEQIEAMKLIWNSFPDRDKPEWLTWNDILEFEKKDVGSLISKGENYV